MARGFLSGIVFGAVVSGVGLVTASQLAGTVEMRLSEPEPEAEAVRVPPGSEFNRERPESKPVLPQSEERPEGTAPPTAPAAEGGGLAPPVPDTRPAVAPEAAAVDEPGLTAPEAGTAPAVNAGAEQAVLPAPGAVQPSRPMADVAPVAESEAPPAAAAGEAPALEVSADAAPEPAADVVPETSAEAEPEEAADVMPETAAETRPGLASDSAPDLPPVIAPDGTESLRLPVPQIDDMAPGVTTDRLPSIGAQPEAEVVAQPALAAHAVAFEAPAGAPLMAVILRDPGEGRPDPSALADFPVPVAVAIDPMSADASEVMASYRAAGVEVLVLAPLPAGAAPADVEVAFQGYLNAVPEAVAVLDQPEAVLQESRSRAVQVAEILSASGHGLITYEKGLNAGLQVAEGAGVKAMTVFRAFDDGGADAAAMKRLLDQGAFRAGQQNGVIMVGELRPETLSALAEWALGTRAQAIALAPVSAVMMNR